MDTRRFDSCQPHHNEKKMDDIIFRLRKRAEIRRQIPTRKSVQEGQPDRLSDLLDEAAIEIENLRKEIDYIRTSCQ